MVTQEGDSGAGDAEVVDLVAALRASVEAAKKRREEAKASEDSAGKKQKADATEGAAAKSRKAKAS